MAYRVFLSHATSDRDIAEELRAEIERFEVRVYMYEHDFQPGQNLPEKLVTSIKKSDALLVLLTAGAAGSAAVNQEIGVALGAEKLVVPLVEDEKDLSRSTLLQGREWVRLDRNDRDKTSRSIADFFEKKRRGQAKGRTIAGLIIAGLFLWANSAEENPEEHNA